MANWYRTGTINVTNGSDVVTGNGTAWANSKVTSGEILVLSIAGEAKMYEIVQVDSNAQVRISLNYPDATDTAITYFIIKSITGTTNYLLMDKITKLLDARTITNTEMWEWANGDLIGAPIDNILANGDFATGDTTDWITNTADAATLYTVENGKVTLDTNLGAEDPMILQAITTVVGKTYAFNALVNSGSSDDWELSLNGQVVIAQEEVTLGKKSASFVATSTISSVIVKSMGGTSSKLILSNIILGEASGGSYPFTDIDYDGGTIWIDSPLKISDSLDSTYDAWITAGNSGTEQDFIDDLKATTAIGTTTTGAPGTSASLVNSGTAKDAILDVTIPRGDVGDQGDQGDQGDAATVTVGTTTTGLPGTNASVVNSGTTGSAVLDVTVPRGDTGPQGPAATVAVGSVTTTAAGTNVAVANSGDANDAVLDFSIPQGDKGDIGVSLPSGGTDGQVLKKVGNNDYVFTWDAPAVAAAWASITDKPTTTSGFGITDAVDTTDSNAWSGKQTFNHSETTFNGDRIDTDNYTSIYRLMLGGSPEGTFNFTPLLFNELAFHRLRGFNTTITGSGKNHGTDEVDKMYNGSAGHLSWAVSGMDAGGAVFHLTDVPDGLKWTTFVGINFGSSNFRAKYIKIETWSNSQWNVDLEISDNARDYAIVKLGSNNGIGNGTEQIRITVKDANTTHIRINHIWAVSHDANMARDIFMPKDGGDMYGSIDMNKMGSLNDFQKLYSQSPLTTTDTILDIRNADSLTTGVMAYLHSNSADTSSRSIMTLWNQNSASTGTTVLTLVQGSTGFAMYAVGNVHIDGLLNGRNVTVDGAKLDTVESGATKGLTLESTPKVASFTAVAGKRYYINTSGGAFTMTLPATPTIGDQVGFTDYGETLYTENLTIGRAGEDIMNSATDLVADVNNFSGALEYSGATRGWILV